jgi:hypothetical protein
VVFHLDVLKPRLPGLDASGETPGVSTTRQMPLDREELE